MAVGHRNLGLQMTGFGWLVPAHGLRRIWAVALVSRVELTELPARRREAGVRGTLKEHLGPFDVVRDAVSRQVN